LIFLDSRGISIDDNKNSWALNLFEYFIKNNKKCLLLNRIKDITVFFTLINFIKSNPYKFKYLITNVGFVDLTPKKMSIINDIADQKNLFYTKKSKMFQFGKYPLINGEIANLFSMDIFQFKKEIVDFLVENFKYSMLIGSFESDENVKVKRKRPIEFYQQIKKANQLLFEISSEKKAIHYIQPLKFQFSWIKKISYDNVHFTPEGHNKMFDIIKTVFTLNTCNC